MPILSGVSGNALASLSAIDSWITTLNSSVAGAARTGFKASKITFGGGTTRLDRPSQAGQLGIQYSEQALNVGGTNTDFSQGQVVASTEFTHMAINGANNAFFVLSSAASTAGSTNFAAGTSFYYTRDGEFHIDAAGYLVNQDGLYLVAEGTDGVETSININTEAGATAFGNDPRLALEAMIDNHNSGATGIKIQHAIVNDLQSLKYSKYGSTIYDATTIAGAAPAVCPLTLNDGNDTGVSSNVSIQGSSLEASNVQLPSALVELSLAQKIYSALTKVIQIDQQKLDNILNLIR